MTTPYAAFVSDPTLFRFGANRDVRARNRRFIYIVTFWVGSFLGAAIARWSTLWVMTAIVLGCKVVVAGMIAVTKGEDDPAAVSAVAVGAGQAWEAGQDVAITPLASSYCQSEAGDDADRRSIHEQQHQHAQRVKRRASSVFERLQDQEPRDERDVAF